MKKSLNRSMIVLLMLSFSMPGINAIGMPASIWQAANLISVTNPSGIESFDLISPKEGWILIKQKLFWTDTNGRSWIDITPPRLGNSVFRSVFFIDRARGWVISDEFDQNGTTHYTLARTSNGGRRWKIEVIPLFSPGEVDSIAQAVYLTFVDNNMGWLVIRTTSSSNFTNGVLFRTNDGGDHWTRFELPIGEKVYFLNENVGWIAGGPAGDNLYRTDDGGETWRQQHITLPDLLENQSVHFQNPEFATSLIGYLPVVIYNQEKSQLELYASEDGGVTWKLGNTSQVDEVIDPSTTLPFAVLDDQAALVAIPEKGEIIRTTRLPGFTTMAVVEQNTLPAILQLEMASSQIGWAKQVSGGCTPRDNPKNNPRVGRSDTCTTEDKLYVTSDGGQNWEPLHLPISTKSVLEPTVSQPAIRLSPSAVSAPAVAVNGSRARLVTGQGFDKCEVPTYEKLQIWSQSSPYDAVNLYIGGVARSCSNLGLTASYISQLNQQGWKFIPTWVGHQAPCYSHLATKMDSNPTIARQQGIDNANSAIDVASSLGLTLADESGAVIYYDLESYNITDTACNLAAKAFIEGWSSQMRARGNIAGLYSSGPPLSEFYNLTEKPDVIWPAHWISSSYDPNATVWNVYFLSNSYWQSNQRLRQYAGPHYDSWGLLSIFIDSNVLEGIVAIGPLDGDFNNDGYTELYSVRKAGGSSGMTEVYLLDGKNSFSSILAHHITPLPQTDEKWIFGLADYNNDGNQDLFAIKQNGTNSGNVEVNVLSGASSFQTIILNAPIPLSQTSPGSWAFLLGDYDRDGFPDLYAINHDSGASGFTEITVLSGIDGFQTTLLNTPTILGKTGSGADWVFALEDYNRDNYTDLVAIDKMNSPTNHTELHILDGARDFQIQSYILPTALIKTGADNGWAFFFRDYNADGIPDLFAVNKASGLSGKTEMNILDGASGYQNYLLNTPTNLPDTGNDCSWDFLTGQCSPSAPTIRVLYLPLLYR